MQKQYEKVSLSTKIVNFFFKFYKEKQIYSDEEKTKKYINEKNKQKRKYNTPIKMGMFKEEFVDMDVYSYNGTIANPKDKFLIYVHGGSFVKEAVSYQIRFAMKIAEKTNSTLIFPVYPLVPTGNYKTMYNLMDRLYKIIEKSKKNINLLGDSAGGGFVLAFSMYLRDKKIKQSSNIIMMSPWVDLSMSNPLIEKYEKNDNFGGIPGNQYAGKLWADDLDIKNYLISPLYGKFNDLAPVTIITGERDLLKPDCVLLSEKLIEEDITHNYIEYKGQGHDFGAYPTKEGQMVINDIASIINNSN